MVIETCLQCWRDAFFLLIRGTHGEPVPVCKRHLAQRLGHMLNHENRPTVHVRLVAQVEV